MTALAFALHTPLVYPTALSGPSINNRAGLVKRQRLVAHGDRLLVTAAAPATTSPLEATDAATGPAL